MFDANRHLFVLVYLLLGGCTAGKDLYFHPANSSHSCENLDFVASTVTIAYDQWLYAVVPLARNQEDLTESNLKLGFFARSSSAIALSTDDLQILDLQTNTAYMPIRLLIKRQFYSDQTAKYHADYEAEFAVLNKDLENFDLVFHVPLDGCSIPRIHYTKGSSKHYAEPIN